ncbi:PilZ domain-containing protein [Methylobacterium sp. J-076]|uniref:PilZ domain-containing protein n=1 Tax=Methylobacterium sp. J-076 TaxID=2836655 RepID=UPI001FBC03FF|nr:PilZ domain-containing protein [Methylobacterium sp. J-076]MCJ2015759.1 PilZ domain-containing protein [Methylobacterium sp. J-076]
MNERRDDARRRVCLGGLIETAAYLPEIPCQVRNVSLAGARLRVAPEAILPERIVLRVPMRNETRLGRVVWRSGDAVGLSFAPDAPTAQDDALADRVKAGEAEIVRLRAALVAASGGAIH